jgi:hypothetical protein
MTLAKESRAKRRKYLMSSPFADIEEAFRASSASVPADIVTPKTDVSGSGDGKKKERVVAPLPVIYYVENVMGQFTLRDPLRQDVTAQMARTPFFREIITDVEYTADTKGRRHYRFKHKHPLKKYNLDGKDVFVDFSALN